MAVEEKLKEAMKRGTPMPIQTKDLVAAAKRTRPSTREWFATARNYVLYSNEGAVVRRHQALARSLTRTG